MPAAAVIPAPQVEIFFIESKMFVVGSKNPLLNLIVKNKNLKNIVLLESGRSLKNFRGSC